MQNSAANIILSKQDLQAHVAQLAQKYAKQAQQQAQQNTTKYTQLHLQKLQAQKSVTVDEFSTICLLVANFKQNSYTYSTLYNLYIKN